jgi:hypothetical protein
MVNPEMCSGCYLPGYLCPAGKDNRKCCPDCDHDAGVRYVEAIRGARAMRSLLARGSDDSHIRQPINRYPYGLGMAWTSECEHGIPEGWITR